MAIEQVPVADSFQEMFNRVQGVEPVIITDDEGRPTGEHKRDDGRDGTGLPVWQISVGVKVPGRKPDVIHIKVPAAAMPEVDDLHPVFGGLQARAWKMKGRSGDVNGGLSWTADTVAARESMPSKARRAVGADKPPVPPSPREPVAA